MWKICLLWFMGLGLVRGGFFDLTDVEDPLALLWNLPIHQKLTKCKVDHHRHGVCMDKAKCLLSGGTPTGHCGLLFTCCSYDTNCVQVSDKKQWYFDSGNLHSSVTNCQYTIKLRNKNVCQVRLDFEHLTLAPSILTSYSTNPSDQKIFSCANDSLKLNPKTYGVPTLCGNNTGQHLYIHVNQTTDPVNAVKIDIKLASRLNELNTYLPKPGWKIRFTQLECPLKKHKFDLTKFGETEHINNDFYSLAPQGAIQYFTDVTGEIRSFGFNTTIPLQFNEATSYPYREHYTIAFRRPSDVCGIRSDITKIGTGNSGNVGLGAGGRFSPKKLYLLHQDAGNNIITCHHYLHVPEYYTEQASQLGEQSSEVCVGDYPFYSLPPGPLYINFKARDLTFPTKQDTENNQGFLIKYDLLNICPLNND